MSKSPASTNPVQSARMSERPRASELEQLASRLGHPRMEITQAYIGALRLPQRSTGEAAAGDAA